METITAIYEKGLLRPLTPLLLPERARVQVSVRQVTGFLDVIEHRRQVCEALVAAGLSLPGPVSTPALSKLSTARRTELAQLFAAGGPLSEIIIAEREGR